MAILTNNFTTNFLSIVIALVILIVTYFKWSFGYWTRKGVKGPPASIPFGNATKIFLQKSTLGMEMKAVYEEFRKGQKLKYASFYLLTKPALVVFDLDLIRSITTKDFQHFMDRGSYCNEDADPLSGNLARLKGQKWKNVRATLAPTFTTGKIKMMFPTLVDCSHELIVVLDRTVAEKSPLEIKDVLGRFTTDVIGSCAFGLECNSLKNPNSEFRQYGKKIFVFEPIDALKRFLEISYPEILQLFNVTVTRKDITNFFMGVVQKTVDYRERHNIFRKDFMHLLIQLKNNVKIHDEQEEVKSLKLTNHSKVGKSLTIPEMTAQAFVFFLAGFETSSTTLTFCLFELVSNLEIQEKLRKEINEVWGRHQGEITYDSIMEMTYMDKCINETLRKHPPVRLLNRRCTKDYKMPDSNLSLQKGTLVFFSVLGIHRDPEYYPDPEKFDPERFSPENKAQRHAYAWLPFGEGPRVCIGLRFGMMQTKVALAVLLRNYRFTLHSKTRLPFTMEPVGIIMSVKGGVWLDIERC